MTLAVVLSVMAFVAVVILAWPLLRRARAAAPRADFERAVYNDQLAEIVRDEERGLIGAEEAAAARTEIARRALTALSASAKAPPPGRSRAGRSLAVALVIALPGLAGLVYLAIGHPGLPDQPFAERRHRPPLSPAAQRAGLTAMTRLLEQRLKKEPDNPGGWALLARIYKRLGRGADAHAAYRKAMNAAAKNPSEAAGIAVAYGEAMVEGANGVVTPEAKAAFDDALKADPHNAGARFYRGLWLLQAGNAKEALAIWVRLEREAPRNAPYLAMLRARINQVAKEFKLDPNAVAP